jgi:hypothetical protein
LLRAWGDEEKGRGGAEKRRGEFGVWESLNIEQGLTNFKLRSEYLLHKSHISVPCSEINLALKKPRRSFDKRGI